LAKAPLLIAPYPSAEADGNEFKKHYSGSLPSALAGGDCIKGEWL
jgi:hypothetical protein